MTVAPLLRVLPRRQPDVGAHLEARADRPALLAGAAQLTFGELAERVAAVADAYAGPRRLVVLTPANDIDSVVEYLGALAAGQVVLMATRDCLDSVVAAYDPDVVASGTSREWRRPGTIHDLHPDLALLLCTSGSTGSAKLVRLSHDNLTANAAAIARRLEIRTTDVASLSLPLTYCYGLSVLHSHLWAGAAVRLSDASVLDEGHWADAGDITTLAGVPHTFDLLERSGFLDRDLPRLRYLTQAGGRMSPDRVRRWAEAGLRRGWDFVVMYGQTEATARIATLPADRVLDSPEAMGEPLDNLTLSLAPADHPDPSVGELVVSGPSVMLGYATTPDDLALGRTVEALHTGDLARRRPDGLWEIVGRRSRFAKVCGLRVDLDEVERTLARGGFVVAAADGGDHVVLGVAEGARGVDVAALLDAGVAASGVARASLEVVALPDLPRTDRGKVDYPALLAAATSRRQDAPEPGRATAAEVTALYARLLGRPDARPSDSFVDLGGDSLSYVEVSLRLESLVGDLPAGWQRLPATAIAATATPPGRGRRVDTSVLLRALAILTIVGTHANAFVALGGAHVLLAVVGFNLARFQLTDVARTERVRRIFTAALRVAVPSVLVIGASSVVGLWAEGLTWRQVWLVNGLTAASWTEPGWYFWFIEVVVHTLVLLALLLALPRVDAWERARPFAFPMVLVGLAMLSRYDIVNVPGDGDHRSHVVFWLVGLGWAAARATTTRHRWIVSAVGVATSIGAFDQAHRNAYVALGLLALVWLPHVRVPAVVARVAGVLASASLWIYLTHWQVYPHLEDSAPWLALGLSLAVGVACSGIVGGLARLRQK